MSGKRGGGVTSRKKRAESAKAKSRADKRAENAAREAQLLTKLAPFPTRTVQKREKKTWKQVKEFQVPVSYQSSRTRKFSVGSCITIPEAFGKVDPRFTTANFRKCVDNAVVGLSCAKFISTHVLELYARQFYNPRNVPIKRNEASGKSSSTEEEEKKAEKEALSWQNELPGEFDFAKMEQLNHMRFKVAILQSLKVCKHFNGKQGAVLDGMEWPGKLVSEEFGGACLSFPHQATTSASVMFYSTNFLLYSTDVIWKHFDRVIKAVFPVLVESDRDTIICSIQDGKDALDEQKMKTFCAIESKPESQRKALSK